MADKPKSKLQLDAEASVKRKAQELQDKARGKASDGLSAAALKIQEDKAKAELASANAKASTESKSTFVPLDIPFMDAATEASLIEANNQLAKKSIDIASRGMGLGGSDSSTYTIINGLGILGGLPKLPVNTDNQGYTFFTKPQLNLSYDNVITSRRMSAYADQRPENMANAIRCLLNPAGFIGADEPGQEVAYGVGLPESGEALDVRSNIVDDTNPFITVLSNTLMSFSGWPDLAPDVYTSNEGIAKEVVSYMDDRPYLYGPFDATATFANMEGDMLTHLLHCWIEYSCRVAEGSMLPFPINVMTNRIDYNTKVYRITLDRSRRHLQGIAATIAFPTAYPIGRSFDFNAEEKLNTEANQVSTQFRCVGAEYNDPILIIEFNKLVSRFNPKMKASISYAPTREDHDTSVSGATYLPQGRIGMPIPDPYLMVEITEAEKLLYNYKCYPFIAENNEFLWYTEAATYRNVQNYLKESLTI